eukprot:CAMPEP_0179065532 /NCGR_PEP_ID=MMETSP0796-20121207/28509_1 /TAXON_ID=73915 /ORGANISM="Pyrodinium bahamense, Strain pbaha01" /LENGTH=263 /DNA_ID=CAMNT_0020762507 /DNA_START=19 /DNA_END=808 /DNA_ORIENTATION=+
MATRSSEATEPGMARPAAHSWLCSALRRLPLLYAAVVGQAVTRLKAAAYGAVAIQVPAHDLLGVVQGLAGDVLREHAVMHEDAQHAHEGEGERNGQHHDVSHAVEVRHPERRLEDVEEAAPRIVAQEAAMLDEQFKVRVGAVDLLDVIRRRLEEDRGEGEEQEVQMQDVAHWVREVEDVDQVEHNAHDGANTGTNGHDAQEDGALLNLARGIARCVHFHCGERVGTVAFNNGRRGRHGYVVVVVIAEANRTKTREHALSLAGV